MKRKYEAAILLAGLFWGVIGLFTRQLGAVGVGSSGLLLIRSGGCCVLFGVLLLCTEPKKFRVRWKDLWLFVCFGMLCTLGFTLCYYRAIERASLSVACTLMYTAPVFVMVLSVFLFRERFTRRKLGALLLAVLGCTLVSGVLEGGGVTPAGVAYGLGAGVGYALYTVFAKLLSRRGYDALQINFYGWLFCVLGGLAVWGAEPVAPALADGRSVLLAVGTIFVSGFLPALLYNWALGGVEASKASMMVSVEPVVASLTGVLAFRETMSLPCVAGVALVLAAVLLLSAGPRRNAAVPGE